MPAVCLGWNFGLIVQKFARKYQLPGACPGFGAGGRKEVFAVVSQKEREKAVVEMLNCIFRNLS